MRKKIKFDEVKNIISHKNIILQLKQIIKEVNILSKDDIVFDLTEQIRLLEAKNQSLRMMTDVNAAEIRYQETLRNLERQYCENVKLKQENEYLKAMVKTDQLKALGIIIDEIAKVK